MLTTFSSHPPPSARPRFLREVDKFNDTLVTAYVTSGGTIFLLLHTSRNYSQFRLFFERLHDIYVKIVMNPFYKLHTKILSREFDRRVKAVAKQYL